MKITLCMLFLFVTTCHVYGQINDDQLLYIEKSNKYQRMKNTGRSLTTFGSILVVVGTVLTLNSNNDSYNSSSTATNGNVEGGAIAQLLGTVCIHTGIPLWIVGGVNHGVYERKLQQLNVGFNLKQNDVGLRVSYRF